MATSFGALCTDFYVNQKLALKMDLPAERETVLHYMDRVRKSLPQMNRFRRYDGELALESARRDSSYQWLAMRRTSIRTGHVNPDTMESAYDFHRLILSLSPAYLSLSPLDVDYIELLFGFDLECRQDHDAVVYEALIAGTPMEALLDEEEGKVLDVQPVFGTTLSERGDFQAYYEVKTRQKSRRGSSRAFRDEPISLFLTLRQYGPVDTVEELPGILARMADRAEALATDKLVPHLLGPISRQITSSAG